MYEDSKLFIVYSCNCGKRIGTMYPEGHVIFNNETHKDLTQLIDAMFKCNNCCKINPYKIYYVESSDMDNTILHTDIVGYVDHYSGLQLLQNIYHLLKGKINDVKKQKIKENDDDEKGLELEDKFEDVFYSFIEYVDNNEFRSGTWLTNDKRMEICSRLLGIADRLMRK